MRLVEDILYYLVFLGVPYALIAGWLIWVFTGGNPFDPRNWR